jgi:hypothetical protein
MPDETTAPEWATIEQVFAAELPVGQQIGHP